MQGLRPLLCSALVVATANAGAATTEFCLDGEFDLGARFQGLRPEAGEFYPARWCVITDDESDRVLLAIDGNSNPDMEGSWSVAFLPPDLVRIVNDGVSPDVEFRTTKAAGEAQRTRLLDPHHAARADEPLLTLQTTADLPLRGRVPVVWTWSSMHEKSPRLEISVDGAIMFRGNGTRRELDPSDEESTWAAKAGVAPVKVPGKNWPSRVAMELVNLADGVYVVRGVRTGFHHMVVETAAGLVVADAPAGWVEMHQFPPTDLVPGLGISGLSEGLVDFLAAEFPDKPIRAVALTHHHDDHAGGARAFAAAGADVYAPAAVSAFLETSLNRHPTPADRLAEQGGRVIVRPVEDIVILDDDDIPVHLVDMGTSPHVVASIGVLAGGYFFQSDLHVPNSDADEPRADRAGTECWFARWATASLPPDTVVINTHSTIETRLSRLEKYNDSDLCSGAAREP